MAKFACFPSLTSVKKKKSKGLSKAADGCKKGSSNVNLGVKPNDHFNPSPENVPKEHYLFVSKSFPSVEKGSSVTPSVLSDDSFASTESTEQADYEGGDERSEIQSMKTDFSDLNLQPKRELTSHESNISLNNCVLEKMETNKEIPTDAMMASEDANNPGMDLPPSFELPVLERSCSNIETTQAKQWINSPKRSSSDSNLHNLSGSSRVQITRETQTSPKSSLSLVLPSRSKKMRRKLCLQNHTNLDKLGAPRRLVSSISAPNLQKLGDKWKKATEPENQWVSFSLELSNADRVDAWVNSLDKCSFAHVDVEEDCDGVEDEQIADLHHLDILDFSEKTCSNTNPRLAEVARANNIIQSLNTFSTVAHISGIGLKVIPSIPAFACLRSVNLSGNCIVSIAPGTLPKGLHTLDLSRNKISTIEGLRDLERLRILNLSYNRIANISHGLSSCTIIKELYLSGNKISNVEGLHRLLKLTVLDLSFNKITTARALGQLVANYNSLLALNLLGNPILANIGDDQLKKSVLSLLPHVTYLNKQSIKPHKVREIVSEKVTKAALGDASESSKRKLTKRLSHGSGSLPKSKVTETIKHGKGRHSTSGK